MTLRIQKLEWSCRILNSKPHTSQKILCGSCAGGAAAAVLELPAAIAVFLQADCQPSVRIGPDSLSICLAFSSMYRADLCGNM